MDKKTLTVACRAFFGMLPGQDLKGFAEEMRRHQGAAETRPEHKILTQKDRNELAVLFQSVNIEIVPATGETEV